MDSSDQQLLGRFAKDGDEAAFTELVRRYLSLVHSAALRLTGNGAAAQDIAQAVFIKLARERLPAEVPLPAWLHRTCRSAAIEWIRSETRRKRREEISAAAHAMTTPPSAWKDISPLLDEVIDQLPLKERHVILGRYIMGKSYAEICSGTGLSEDAARMCGNRALDKMRQLLAKRGVATSAAALGLSLPAHALLPVAPAFISSVSVLALSSTAPAAAMSFTSLKIIAMTLQIDPARLCRCHPPAGRGSRRRLSALPTGGGARHPGCHRREQAVCQWGGGLPDARENSQACRSSPG